MFSKVLIANRGAIAVRIERTLRRLGVASVAIYTEADQDSLHVDQADEAVLIGGGPAKDSYLNTALILDTAVQTGAQAIHPGYGFLSENADFVRACHERGIVFIGPTPEQIEMFGQKHLARAMAEKVDIPMLPGTALLANIQEALKEAARIGYPVMLKATAGGGGIGMRVCADETALRSAFDVVGHLAQSNFNNGSVFLEKYIARARHVEVQLFGNRFGEVVTLGERDCSIQRRNQKVVEESPAPHLPPKVRNEMAEAARRLASEVGYRNAGTVEFLYDPETSQFYFLEVNTRLQVEHGVTEEVLGIDLVEWMVREAADELQNLKSLVKAPQGHSIQVRIYAEDTFNQFRPSAGPLDSVMFSDKARVETWVRGGVTISSLYDPLLAKVIVHGIDRMDAIQKLVSALEETRLYGITTNRSYLLALLALEDYQAGTVYTQLLTHFEPAEHALEVVDGGLQSTVQDWPGRVGYWHVGVPPCGPMDPFSFRIGNKLLGNDEHSSGLELTLRGGAYCFRDEMWFCITGADMKPTLDEMPIPMYQPVLARRGQVVRFGESQNGMRAYLMVAGGFDMPSTLKSSATFTLGGFGGHGGRALTIGDVLAVNRGAKPINGRALALENRPEMRNTWTIGVIPGPQSTKEFLQPDYLTELTETKWEVHYNSSRTGVRLIGPAPNWTRDDGGDAGLHPSNIHDNPYAIGALDLTGDMPILLGPDGPSLGGFVCPVTTAKAELWKIGQLRPGDVVQFQLLTLEEAGALRETQENRLKLIGEGIRQWEVDNGTDMSTTWSTQALTPDYPVLAYEERNRQFAIAIRCCGDENLLVEYGAMELDLRLRFQVHVLMTALEGRTDIPIIDLTPGIRSLQVHIDPARMSIQETSRRILEIDKNLPPLESIRVPSRIVRLPLSWDDPSTQLAIQRYQQNVRPDAPWCPSNLEFIRRINGLKTIEDVKKIVFDATYLVLGLGDVYLGAPVAIPVDPRQRLVTTKYNPARTWTPENAVGIGGAYLCVYGMEGPGGYQFVGRTVQMWDRLRSTKSFLPGMPWLLRFFDQIRFYPVGAEELLKLRQDFLRGRFEVDIEETNFDLGEYLHFLTVIKDSADIFRSHQQESFKIERDSWKTLGLAEYVSEKESQNPAQEDALPLGASTIRSTMPGSVWKVLVDVNTPVKKGETLIVVESMKMEFALSSPSDGIVSSIHVNPGDQVQAGQLMIGLTETTVDEVPL